MSRIVEILDVEGVAGWLSQPQIALAAPASAPLSQSATDIDLITNIDSALDVVHPGDANSYTVTVENRGPSAATNPSWLIEVASAASISNINCVASGGATCPGTFNPQSINGIEGLNAVIPSMPVDSVLTLTFDTVARNGDGNFSADTYIIPDAQIDANPETNDADINVSILPRLLSWGVTKNILRYEDAGGNTVANPVPGGSVVYEVVVVNNGVDDIVDLRLTETMGADEGTGTIPTLIAGTSVSGYKKNFYVGGTTMTDIACTAANGAVCPASQSFTAETLETRITIPLLPGRTRAAQTAPGSYPESTATFEVTAHIGEVACSTVADTHRTILNKAQLPSSTDLYYKETSGLTTPYGPGDNSDNLADVTFDLPAPTCPAYDVVTQVTESATQAASGIDEVGAFEYTVVVSNNGPDTVTDMPFFFGTHFIEAGASSWSNGTRYHPDYWANLWALNSPTCVAAAGGVCPTGYNLNATQVLETVDTFGTPIPDGSQATGSHDLPDATAIIPSLSSGGTITFTFTGTSGELANKCGIPKYVNAHAHALPLDQMGETNIDIPSGSFTGYYLRTNAGWPGGNMSHGSYYGNNGFSLRTQWNTGDTGGFCDGDNYDLSITMTGPFPDGTGTTPMAGSLPPDTVVYYRVRVNNLDDAGLPGGIDFIDDRTAATGGFMAGFEITLNPFPFGGIDWLDLDTAFGIGEALPDHYHPLDATPGLVIDQPPGYAPGYSVEAEETSLPWAAWEDVGFDCLATTGGAECPDTDDLTDYYQNFDTINAAGESGNRGYWGTSTGWNLGYWLPIKDFEGDSLHLPEGSNIDFLIPYKTPPLSKPCVPGGDIFTYDAGGKFEATVYGTIPDAYKDVISERDPDNNESNLSFQMEVPACAASLDIDKRTVVPAAVDVVPQDGIVRYEVDLTYPITAANALDVAQFIDIPTPDCGSGNPASCAQYEIINVVSCSVTSGNAICPVSIPIGQQLAQDGTLSAISAGTIDTRWGTPNAADVANGAAFEPGSSITIILEARLSGADTNLGGVENTAVFASDPDSSQYAGGMYAEDTELLSVESADSMVLQKAVGPTDAQQGDIITFTLDIINNGPADGQGAYVTDVVPANLLVDNPAGYTNITCVPLATAPPLAADFNVADCANLSITNNGAAGFQIDMTGSWVMNSGYRILFNAVAPADSLSIENTAILAPPPQSPTQRFAGVSDSTVNFRTPEQLQVLIGDRVWIEDDNDGLATTGVITPVVGSVVTAIGSNGTVYTDTTDASGNYTISVPADAVYTVTVGTPFGTTSAGTLITTDSDPNTQNDLSHDGSGTVVTVDTNDNLTIDFGFYELPPGVPSLALSKTLDTPEPVNVGQSVVFTIRITNTGDVVITTLPLSDTYDTTYLVYDSINGSTPATDNNANDGELDWSDLTLTEGDLAPGDTIEVVVRFTAATDTAALAAQSPCVNGGESCNVAAVNSATAGSDPVPPVEDSDDIIIEEQITGKSTLGDFVWFDTNSDGIKDPSETGINGVIINLYDSTGLITTTVTMSDTGGVGDDTGTTNGDGFYDFQVIESTVYTVEIDPSNFAPGGALEGYTYTGDKASQIYNGDETRVVGMPADQHDENDVDFSYVTHSLGNYVWIDADNSGDVTAGESSVPDGVVMELLDSGGTVIMSTTTTSGYYLFDGLAAGDYQVRVAASNFQNGSLLEEHTDSTGPAQEADPDSDDDQNDNGLDGSVLTTDGIVSALVTLGGTEPTGETATASGTAGDDGAETPDVNSNLTVDFGIRPPLGSIGDTIWGDLDEDGDNVLDGTDVPLEGVVVELELPDGSTITTTTDISGTYLFPELPHGTYTVTVDTSTLPTGYQTTPTYDPDGTLDSTSVVTLDETTPDNTDQDFSYPPDVQPVMIGDRVWIEDDNDGVATTGVVTPSLGSVVTAIGSDGTVYTDTTDAMGYYTITVPANDVYTVTVGTPLGTTVAVPTGGLLASDSDPATNDDTSHDPAGTVVTVGTEDNLTIDFGFYEVVEQVALGNIIWIDDGTGGGTANNGIIDGAEAGLDGVTVELYAGTTATGTPLSTTVTSGGGFYLFDELDAGDYVVHIPASQFAGGAPLDGYQSSAGAGTDDANDDDVDENGLDTLDNGGTSSAVINLTPDAEPTSEAGQGSYPGTLDDDNVNMSVDFGFYQPPTAPPVLIGDRVWIEDDNDGVASTGVVTPVVGSVVTAIGSDGTVYTDTTDAMGYYTITVPANDVYTVTVGTPVGTVAAVPTGGLIATDNDPNSDDDTSHDPAGTVVTVGTEDNLTIDFGFYPSMRSFELSKTLNTPSPVRVGEKISFTIRITNTGSMVMTTVPLTDTYNDAYMSYTAVASPEPDNPNVGELVWSNLTASGTSGFGADLNPGETFAVTVEFVTKLDTTGQPNDSTINRAEFQGITDTAEIQVLAPTGVEFVMREVAYENEKVVVRWETADESDVAGFYIYRKIVGDDDSERIKLTLEMLVAQKSGSPGGTSYAYEDESAEVGIDYRYLLGVLDTNGSETLDPLGDILTQRTLNGWSIFLPVMVK